MHRQEFGDFTVGFPDEITSKPLNTEEMMKTVKRRLLPPSMYESLSYMVLGLDLLMVMR